MKNKVGFGEGLTVLILMIAIIGVGVIAYSLPPQTPVLLVISLLILWGRIRKFSWSDVHDGLIEGIKTGLIPIIIFMLVGALISVWIAAGIIPSMMVFGFNILNMSWFVPSTFLICAIIGSSIGSAFTIISTLGIALMGIGTTMGLNPALIAGAVVSGAVFGDKMSPLSDSTNLASAIAGSELFAHIKNMLWTTIPAFIVSFILFFILGSQETGMATDTNIKTILDTLHANFSISPWALLPIILMVICAWRKIPAVGTLLINIFFSVTMIFILKPTSSIPDISNLLMNGYVAHTHNEIVDALLSRGGISSMMSTVSLILFTLGLGGLLMKFNLIEIVMNPLIAKLNTTGKLIMAAIFTGIGVNIFVGEQYLSAILPGNAFKPAFKKAGLDPLALSRVLEDGGTVINYLIPWGVAGAFAAQTLNVPVLSYLPFAFFSLLSPIFSILSGFTGIGLKRLKPKSPDKKPEPAIE